MRELILAGVGFCLQLAVFFCIGSLLIRVLKIKAEASKALIFGYILYFAVFEVAVIPATLCWMPLKTFSLLWLAVIAAAVGASLVFCRKQWKNQVSGIKGIWQDHSWMLLLVAAVILVQCAIVVLYEDTTVDAAYYVGTVSTSVFTDTLGRYNPYSGRLLNHFQIRYALSGYPMNNAVWCKILGIHPIVQAKLVMSVMHVLVANSVIYHIGKKLFQGKKRAADLMVCFVCLLQLFSYTIYTPGTFFFTRSYEGKALLANVSIPLVLYCGIWLYEQKGKTDKNIWILLFLTSLSALCFSGSSIILPVAVSAAVLPVLIVRKRFSDLIPYVLCMLPNILYMAAYMCVKYGFLTLRSS